jgi:cysteinyl-tRNA synthetase
MFSKLFGGDPAPLREITLHNTLTNTHEVFEPVKGNAVKMYSCGPTVYDYIHIGNLRAFLTADITKRVLIRNGYSVNHTMNLTDFGHLTDDGDAGEDKMMKGLKREGLPVTLEGMKELADIYIEAFKRDLDALNILPPTTWARASEHVGSQIKLIKTLQDKGYTYETSDGVYFDIEKFKTYGKLGNVNIDQMKSGARVEVNIEKKHPADFAVWKKSDLGWDSSLGKGFPGWHIECSAMALATLGKSIDIHTGGEDLQYTHHNAEIAQCECATGKPFVKYWLHNAFVNIDGGQKIAKSKGNAVNLRNILDRGFTGDDYRYWLLTAHYRSQVNFSWAALEAAKQALYRLKRHMFEDFKQKAATPNAAYLDRFDERIADDMDTPGAIAVMWEMIKDKDVPDRTKAGTLLAMDEVLDIGLSEDKVSGLRMLGVIASADIPEDIQALIDARETARMARDWPMADAIRQQIADKGYTLEDSEHGPKVTKG